MSDSEPMSRRGRRARALTPEESAALESRTASMVTGEMSPLPGARGAVAAPEADAPVPKLRKFGRRARIIELTDPVDGQAAGLGATGGPGADTAPGDSAQDADETTDRATGDKAAGSGPVGSDAEDAGPGEPAASAHAPAGPARTATGRTDSPADAPDAALEQTGSDDPGQLATTPSATAPRPARRTTTIDRDRDGVELGELPVSETPDPRPAPRFDGKVLHRPERSGGRSLLWVVWALIAVAFIVLIVLMVTGVLGQDSAAAAFTTLDLAAPDIPDLLSDHPVLEEAAA